MPCLTLLDVGLGNQLLHFLYSILDFGHLDNLVHTHLTVLDAIIVLNGFPELRNWNFKDSVLVLHFRNMYDALFKHHLWNLDDSLMNFCTWRTHLPDFLLLDLRHFDDTLDDFRLHDLSHRFLDHHLRNLVTLLHKNVRLRHSFPLFVQNAFSNEVRHLRPFFDDPFVVAHRAIHLCAPEHRRALRSDLLVWVAGLIPMSFLCLLPLLRLVLPLTALGSLLIPVHHMVRVSTKHAHTDCSYALCFATNEKP
mmetsp:Transcript_7731/g.21126  ORF Transcript_7731/g.21126 Transcript_7731/m.21126 type:complete len:251 (+) Transcript_7731:257-1009(+)